ncbi:uncharacterized protein LOC130676639 [Microplitis mediator]|uniref:uncharacterized protein LOC130676639 n=1 Tax=Microplitis mediator TaxID=375433 RepID=UPI002553643C|nr:uncharacterized protein LOC130676639 [Microplitis mediator]
MGINNRSGRKISRPARNVNLVMNAMRNLRDENGSTVANIMEYISDTVEHPATKRQVLAALKRGVEYGIMDRKRGRYFLPGEKPRINLSRANHDHTGDSEGDSDGDGDSNPGDAGATRKSQVFEDRGHRFKSRNTDKTKRENISSKSKDSSRRKRKPSRKSTGRRSVKRTRFARSLKSYDLSDYYKNPDYRASGVSSIDSMEYWEGEDFRRSYIN